ncbi:MAG: hypothetical protein ACE5GN_01640 [Waddliaceae bacterium]
MKINNNIFSFPPYISTCWSNIAALHMKGATLIVNLTDGETIHIPDLKSELLKTIFDSHAAYLEDKVKQEPHKHQAARMFPFQQLQGETADIDFPFRFGIGAMDGWGAALQHNPEQANTPSLPEEVLEKIKSIAKIIAPDDPMATPKPEPHCNCMHCQIARAINEGLGLTDIYQKGEDSEEDVSDEELQFQQWEIQKTDDKVYTVINRLDTNEKYSVFLGSPVGCTCGIEGCEHILAVLKS